MDPETVLFPASRAELEVLASSKESRSKDVCLVSFPLGIGAILSYVAEVTRHEPCSGDFVLLVAYLSIAMAMTPVGSVSAWWWFKDASRSRQLLDEILNRPIQYVILSVEEDAGGPSSPSLELNGAERQNDGPTTVGASDSEMLREREEPPAQLDS